MSHCFEGVVLEDLVVRIQYGEFLQVMMQGMEGYLSGRELGSQPQEPGFASQSSQPPIMSMSSSHNSQLLTFQQAYGLGGSLNKMPE